jgi:predicted nucleic acid-binding protein
MSNPILPDTDVMVDFLRGRPEAVSFLKSHADRILLSPIVIAELYAGVKGVAELAVLNNFIQAFPAAPVTAEIAMAAGLYKRDYGKSHGVGLGDAILAATAKSHGAELKTLNIKHYPMLANLKPAYRKP